jgi:mRNA interferase MazF
MNQALDTVVVCPLTSQLRPTWRTRVSCVCAGKRAEIAMDQIRTVAKLRLIKHLGSVGPDAAWSIRSLIVEMYGTEQTSFPLRTPRSMTVSYLCAVASQRAP